MGAMGEHITKGDLLEVFGKLRDDVHERFERDRDERNETIERVEARMLDRLDKIDGRLTQLNGSVARHERDNAVEAQKVRALEKTVFRRSFGRRTADAAGAGERWAGALSKREYGLVMGGVGIIGVLLKLLDFVLTKGAAVIIGAH